MPAEFGVGTATYVIVASMVGAGILTTSGYTVASIGSNQYMLVLWVAGGISALCAALTLAELSAALPRSGGEYVILHEAYGPLAAFLSGWVTFLLGFAAPIAVAASGSASYLVSPLGLNPGRTWLFEQVIATLLILVFTAVHCSGRRQTAKVQATVTVIKLVLMVAFVIAGLAVGWHRASNLADPVPIERPVAQQMLYSLVYISYAYFGWNAAAYLAGEVAEPQRRLPQALLLGTGAVVLLYLSMNVVYGLALPAAEVQALARAKQDIKPIAQLAAVRLFGRGVATPVSVAAGLMMLSSLSAYILAGPRVIYAMARARQFPAFAGRLSRRAQTPALATFLLAAFGLLMLWSGTFENIMTYASVGMAIFSMLTIGSVYVLRWRQPDLPRPFRTPGYPVVPAIYLLASLLLTAAAFLKDDQSFLVSIISLASILAGVPFYYAWKWLTGRGAKMA